MIEKMGWEKGIEPSTSGTTNQRSNRLSYTHHKAALTLFKSKQDGKSATVVCLIHFPGARISPQLKARHLPPRRQPGKVQFRLNEGRSRREDLVRILSG